METLDNLFTACVNWQNMHDFYIYFSAIKPECTTDPECPDHLACIREKCQNPCFTTTCGVNAECRVTRHRAICYCKQGYEGDPYRICEERKQQYHLVSHVESDFIRILLTLYFSWMQKR